jgi:LuxR family maltose regulon positive regulatory protein
MHRTIARVKGGRLYQAQTESRPIAVGTPAWFNWLEQHRAFLFFDRTGRFTAYKSGTDPDGESWEAGRIRQGKRSSLHLGRSQALTLERLQAAAQTLAVEYALLESSEAGQRAPSTHGKRESTATIRSPRSLMHTKLYRPRGGSDVIRRARLLERLNAALGGKATLVCAPAGFGKSTLVAEWVQTIERPTAWLSLDEHDDELVVFVSSLVAALQTVFPDAFAATTGLLSAPHLPPPYRVATLLINDLAALSEDIVLVLDDYHCIRHPGVHTLLETLISYLPPQVHVVLISRFDPPLPLATWVAKGYLQTVNRADLRLSLQETKAFLTRLLGEELANATAATIEGCTEGWIALVRLAALSLRGTSDAAVFLERLLHGAERSVSRYLLEEVVDQLEPWVQTMLERLSILEQCCAELCVAISGDAFTRQQVQSTLDACVRAHLLLVPLDDHQGWYRFHHLLQELLQQRLREHSSAEEIALLHRRASTWYVMQGLIDEAIRHALLAGDAWRAAQLVEAHFHWAFEQEGWVQMERWLRLLPEDQVQRSPCLLLARAWIVQTHGRLSDLPPLLAAVERLEASIDSDRPDQDGSFHRLLHAVMAISWCQFQYFTGRPQESLQSAQRALGWNPPGEEYLASLALMYLALSQQATGQEIVALVTLQEALLDHATQASSTARLLFSQALVFLAAGKLHQVEHLAQYFLRLAQQADLTVSEAWGHWLLGVVQYEWNHLDAAVSHFSAVLAKRYHVHSWTVQEAMYGLALTYQALGLDREAQKVTRDLLDFVQEQHSQRDLLVAYAFCGQLALVQDEVEKASPWQALAGKQEELVGPMTSFEVPPITHAWMLLARGDDTNVARAQLLLSLLWQYVQAIHSTRKAIQVLALLAWAYHLQGRDSEALDALERSLILARPGGFIRTFADLPALYTVLQELRTRRGDQHAVNQMDAYLKRVLVAMNPVAARAVLREELLRQEGLEP